MFICSENIVIIYMYMGRFIDRTARKQISVVVFLCGVSQTFRTGSGKELMGTLYMDCLLRRRQGCEYRKRPRQRIILNKVHYSWEREKLMMIIKSIYGLCIVNIWGGLYIWIVY